MARPKAPCGTDAAYRRHLRNGERIDAACRRAHTEKQRASRRPPTSKSTPPAPEAPPAGDGDDDMKLIVDTLRTAFKSIADSDPTRLAPIAREFRAAVEATRATAEPVKEKSLAEQLAEARAARAARTTG